MLFTKRSSPTLSSIVILPNNHQVACSKKSLEAWQVRSYKLQRTPLSLRGLTCPTSIWLLPAHNSHNGNKWTNLKKVLRMQSMELPRSWVKHFRASTRSDTTRLVNSNWYSHFLTFRATWQSKSMLWALSKRKVIWSTWIIRLLWTRYQPIINPTWPNSSSRK